MHALPPPPAHLPQQSFKMADSEITDANTAAALKAKRSFRKFSYRGIELDALLDLSNEQVSLATKYGHRLGGGAKRAEGGRTDGKGFWDGCGPQRCTPARLDLGRVRVVLDPRMPCLGIVLAPPGGLSEDACGRTGQTSRANLLPWAHAQFMELVHARARRRFQRGLKRRPMGLIKKLRKAKKECLPNEKPAVVKTHLRDMLVVPEMIGSVIGIYNGKTFNTVEIKPEMTGHYLGEFSMTCVGFPFCRLWSPWSLPLVAKGHQNADTRAPDVAAGRDRVLVYAARCCLSRRSATSPSATDVPVRARPTTPVTFLSNKWTVPSSFASRFRSDDQRHGDHRPKSGCGAG